MEITSVNNELVKETVKLQQKKYRDESGMFLLEGFKAIEEAYLSGLEIVRYFVQNEKSGKYLFLKGDCIKTNEAVLKKVSTTSTPPEVVAVAKKPMQKTDIIGNNVILLEDIKDLGNLGTIIRSAVAFNVDTIVLYGETVDLYNPKIVRSTVGNLWKINFIETNSIDKIKELFLNYERIATLPKSNNSEYLKSAKFPCSKNLIMFGTESTGLREELKNFATKNITIEMSDKVESLNLSISAGILMYELFKS